MTFIIGFITVIACTLGGYVLHGGRLGVLYQPTEYLIIVGAAFGQFFISTPGKGVKGAFKSLKYLIKGTPFKKDDYIELLKMLYTIFKLMKTKGMLELEAHIEKPYESALFAEYPKFISNHHAVDFLCDYLRIMTMGVDDHYQLEEQIDKDLETHHHVHELYASGWVNMGDAMPAIGIVAAVLGVIITMGSITEPPEILGGLIGAALVGTFLGVFLAYGFIGPMGKFLNVYFHDEATYYNVIKVGLIAHLKGNAPAVSIEFARNNIAMTERPNFQEVEAAINGGEGSGG